MTVGLWRALWRDEKNGPLAGLLILLTMGSGLVDAVSILRLGDVFVAAMTGNLLFIGFGLAGASGFSVATSITALSAFAVGSFVGGEVTSKTKAHRGRVLRDVAASQFVILASAAAVVGANGGRPTGAGRYVVVAILAAGMGTQTATVGRLGIPQLTTTVMTRTLASLLADLRTKGRSLDTQLRVLALLVISAGAVTGASLVLDVRAWCALALAALLALVVAVVAHLSVRSGVSWDPAS